VTLPDFHSPPYFLQLTIEGELLTPRQKLASVPTSFHARDADEMDADWEVNAGAVYRWLGNIGLGTNTPWRELEIQRDANDLVGVMITNMNPNEASGEVISFADESGEVAYVCCYDDNSTYDEAMIIANNRPTNGHIRLRTNATDRIVVERYGDVGIGVMDPSERLDVGGTVEMTGMRLTTSPTAGYVLTSDGIGTGTWQPSGAFTLPYSGSVIDTWAAFEVTQHGSGGNSRFITPGASTYSGVYSQYDGTSAAVKGYVGGPTGYAGVFAIEGATNPNPSLIASTWGTGPALRASSGYEQTVVIENDWPSWNTDIVTIDYTGSTASADVIGLVSTAIVGDYYGIGAEFGGGYQGTYAYVSPTGGQTYFGHRGFVSGGSGTNYGIHGHAYGSGTNRGVYGYASGGAANHAGYFDGNVRIIGNCDADGYSLKRDHPLAPESKYLVQWTIESPEMTTVVNGNVTLDGTGEAVVKLPDWYVRTTTDHRYQLTCIGGHAPVYVAEKVTGGAFRIAGGEPGMEVSWQITGVRDDVHSRADSRPVEIDKPAEEQGRYANPELFGLPRTASINYDAEEEAKQARLHEPRPAEPMAERVSAVETAD